ncbi:hypothetical protein DL768_004249 [Monosporascus sp. mg162]|nr:hypothetical protein DL768_004249 [Monosporascus sp. mg162]
MYSHFRAAPHIGAILRRAKAPRSVPRSQLLYDQAFRCTSALVLRVIRSLTTATADGVFKTQRRTFEPSLEQLAIVEFSRTQNVVVSARPGSGKTATAEAIVAANAGRAVALVTYSKRLQLETARRLEDYTCDVYTFHGLAGTLFKTVAFNDTVLRTLRREGGQPTWTGQPYEIIILDELQDCTDDLFWLTCAFISSVTHAAGGRAPRIVALGDERQAIYGFRGADSRYLSLAPSTMAGISPYPWTRLSLSKSFRLSQETSRFVNDVFLGGDKYVIGTHHGPAPLYLHVNPFKIDKLARRLVRLILKYGAERTAILAPFVRSNTALARLTNTLSRKYGIPIAVSISDDVPLDDLVIGGKVCVSTYHQFKGNERDLVIVYGVDASYFEILGRDLPDDTCPNETFVALTRAIKQLVLIHSADKKPMPFLSLSQLDKAATFVSLSSNPMQEPDPVGRPLQLGLLLPWTCSVSDMARHVPDEQLEAIVAANIKINELEPPLPRSEPIAAPEITLTDKERMHYEAVGDINGLAVVAAFEHFKKGTLTTLDCAPTRLPSIPSAEREQAAWYCREACAYEAQVSGYESRSIQMKDHAFDWLAPYLGAAKERLSAQFAGDEELEFEARLREEKFTVRDSSQLSSQATCLRGRADIVHHHGDGDATIWEIKFVGKLSLQHAIQACAYAYLWATQNRRRTPPRVMLYNVQDGEKREITAPDGVEGFRRVVEEVLRAKYSKTGVVSTQSFLASCARAKEEVEKLWEGHTVEMP